MSEKLRAGRAGFRVRPEAEHTFAAADAAALHDISRRRTGAATGTPRARHTEEKFVRRVVAAHPRVGLARLHLDLCRGCYHLLAALEYGGFLPKYAGYAAEMMPISSRFEHRFQIFGHLRRPPPLSAEHFQKERERLAKYRCCRLCCCCCVSRPKDATYGSTPSVAQSSNRGRADSAAHEQRSERASTVVRVAARVAAQGHL